MKDFSITAKVPEKKDAKTGKVLNKAMEATVVVQMPDAMEEAEKVFGADACLSNMAANWRVTLQGNIRAALRKGEAPDAIAKRLAEAKMGVASTGGSIDPQAAFIAKFKLATPEGQAKMIEELKLAAGE